MRAETVLKTFDRLSVVGSSLSVHPGRDAIQVAPAVGTVTVANMAGYHSLTIRPGPSNAALVVRQPASPAPFVTSTSTVDSFPVSRALQEREAWSSRLPPYMSCCSAPNQASSVSHLCPKLCSCSALSVILLCARYSHLHRCCPLGGCPIPLANVTTQIIILEACSQE